MTIRNLLHSAVKHSMRLQVNHKTRYDYDAPAVLNSHALYLKPLQRAYMRVQDYRLVVDPVPDGLEEQISIEGNSYYQVWFSGETPKLEIDSSFIVDVRPFNPFSFIINLEFIEQIEPESERMFRYSPDQEVLLYAPLQTKIEPNLRQFADRIFAMSPDNPIGYLNALTAEVHRAWSHIIREEENLWTPSTTFEAREGSCRDLSWMLTHMLRMQGLAARFVSGYAFNPELDEGNELHAWVETYLPGAGWIGVDPSLGLFADQNYIPLATSSFAQDTLPVHGNYGGTARSRLHTEVNIRQLDQTEGPGQ